MSNIPLAREELYRVAMLLEAEIIGRHLGAIRIRRIIRDHLTREPPVRRAPDRHVKITPEMKRDIRAYARRNPEAHQVDIGNAFGVNPGRVSEILNGKR